MTSFILKIIAVISMSFDHFGTAFIGHFNFLNFIGRIAFPIFAFQISEGYLHTKNIKKYIARLFIFACISQIAFYLFSSKFIPTSIHTLNILFTLLFGLFAMLAYDYIAKTTYIAFNKKIFGLLIVCIIAYIGQLLQVDYGFWGIIVIFSFYLFKNNKTTMVISFIVLCLMKYGLWIINYGFNAVYIGLCISTILAILPIYFYTGKQGLKVKYLLYIFYPLHLLLLYFVC